MIPILMTYDPSAAFAAVGCWSNVAAAAAESAEVPAAPTTSGNRAITCPASSAASAAATIRWASAEKSALAAQ